MRADTNFNRKTLTSNGNVRTRVNTVTKQIASKKFSSNYFMLDYDGNQAIQSNVTFLYSQHYFLREIH